MTDGDEIESPQLYNTRAEAVKDLFDERQKMYEALKERAKVYVPSGTYSRFDLKMFQSDLRALHRVIAEYILQPYEYERMLTVTPNLEQFSEHLNTVPCLSMKIPATYHTSYPVDPDQLETWTMQVFNVEY